MRLVLLATLHGGCGIEAADALALLPVAFHNKGQPLEVTTKGAGTHMRILVFQHYILVRGCEAA